MKVYKPSRFNVTLEKQQKKFVMNLLSLMLAEVSDEVYQILTTNRIREDEIPAGSKEDLLKAGLIVNSDLDDLRFLELKHLTTRYGNRSIGHIIAPTLNCNFDCSYCYEGDKPVQSMNDEIIRRIALFLEKQARSSQTLSIRWLGGEPLLAWKQIVDLSHLVLEVCDRFSINYLYYLDGVFTP